MMEWTRDGAVSYVWLDRGRTRLYTYTNSNKCMWFVQTFDDGRMTGFPAQGEASIRALGEQEAEKAYSELISQGRR